MRTKKCWRCGAKLIRLKNGDWLHAHSASASCYPPEVKKCSKQENDSTTHTQKMDGWIVDRRIKPQAVRGAERQDIPINQGRGMVVMDDERREC